MNFKKVLIVCTKFTVEVNHQEPLQGNGLAVKYEEVGEWFRIVTRVRLGCVMWFAWTTFEEPNK